MSCALMSHPDRALGIFVLRVLVLLVQGTLGQPLAFVAVPKTWVEKGKKKVSKQRRD